MPDAISTPGSIAPEGPARAGLGQDSSPARDISGLVQKLETVVSQFRARDVPASQAAAGSGLRARFQQPGDVIVLLGTPDSEVGGDAAALAATIRPALAGFLDCGVVRSVDVSQGGNVAVALAAGCLGSRVAPDDPPAPVGAVVDFSGMPGLNLEALLFSENGSWAMLTTPKLSAFKVVERAKLLEIPVLRLGTVGGDMLILRDGSGEGQISLRELLPLTSGTHDVPESVAERVDARSEA